MYNKISLAGDLGGGKSTVSGILSERLGMEIYSTGRIVRELAEEAGMSIVEFNKYMETHPEVDKLIDDGLVALSDDPRSLIIDSRMAWHFVKNTLRVYLSCDIETAAARILCAKRDGERTADIDEMIANTKARRASECLRYKEKYGVDISDLTNYALVIDTSIATPDEVADVINLALECGELDGTLCFISPESLHYLNGTTDMDRVRIIAEGIERGAVMPTVGVFLEDGKFYIDSGVDIVLAYALAMQTFVPALLVEGTSAGKEYVTMKNSL